MGPWIPLENFKDYLNVEFVFSVNGQLKQKGLGTAMTLNPAQCLSYAAENFEIVAGDILFTGTPAGVGPVKKGDKGNLSWGKHLNFDVQW